MTDSRAKIDAATHRAPSGEAFPLDESFDGASYWALDRAPDSRENLLTEASSQRVDTEAPVDTGAPVDTEAPVDMEAPDHIEIPDSTATMDKRGSNAEFDRWYEQHSPMVRGLVYRAIFNKHTADDVIQNAWMRVARVIDRYDPARSSESTFVGLITRRAIIDQIQRELRPAAARHRSAAALDEAAFQTAVEPKSPLESDESFEEAMTALSDLPPKLRTITEARFLRGLSLFEIACLHDIPVGTVKSSLHRAVRMLRLELDLSFEG